MKIILLGLLLLGSFSAYSEVTITSRKTGDQLVFMNNGGKLDVELKTKSGDVEQVICGLDEDEVKNIIVEREKYSVRNAYYNTRCQLGYEQCGPGPGFEMSLGEYLAVPFVALFDTLVILPAFGIMNVESQISHRKSQRTVRFLKKSKNRNMKIRGDHFDVLDRHLRTSKGLSDYMCGDSWRVRQTSKQ